MSETETISLVPQQLVAGLSDDLVLSGWMDRQRESWRLQALQCVGKQAADLTDDERFALAVSAGASIRAAPPFVGTWGLAATIRFQTANVVAISDNPLGGFTVAIGPITK